MLRLLQGDEHDIVRTQNMMLPQPQEVDQKVARACGTSIGHVRRMRALHRKYQAIIAAFGPGIVFVLSGGNAE